MRALRAVLASLVIGLFGVVALVAPAAADEGAPYTQFHTTVDLSEDGVAHVTIEMTLDFGQRSGRGPLIDLVDRQADGQNPDEWYSFPISDIEVTSSTGA